MAALDALEYTRYAVICLPAACFLLTVKDEHFSLFLYLKFGSRSDVRVCACVNFCMCCTRLQSNHCTCNVTVTCDSMPILVVCLCATVVYVCTQSGSCALALLLSSLRQKRLDGNDALMLLLLYIQVYSTHVPLFTPYRFAHFRFSYILRYTCAKFQM